MEQSQLQALTLAQLNRRITSALAVAPDLNDVWIVAETSDLRSSGGHCYMELVQKDEAGRALAKARAVIWASNYSRISAEFAAATGTRLASDMKVMARVSVSFHAVYGMSLVISAINYEYTAGDLIRHRNEIIARLRADGVFDLNRSLPWPVPAQRIAVISARGAAGYGDFMRHLYGNGLRLRFSTELFEAVMQGQRTAASVVSALEAINSRIAEFDCVVIIRGGGAVSELACFDDYTLAFNLAQFPLPVIVGIGHERDVTVLDYVAHTRVKTPTAAAELLVTRMTAEYDRLLAAARAIQTAAKAKIAGQQQQLEYCRGQLPALARAVIVRARARLTAANPQALAQSVRAQLQLRRQRLQACTELMDALAPEATLKRGFSITRLNGRAVKNAVELKPGDCLTTVFASGEASTTVTSIQNGQ